MKAQIKHQEFVISKLEKLKIDQNIELKKLEDEKNSLIEILDDMLASKAERGIEIKKIEDNKNLLSERTNKQEERLKNIEKDYDKCLESVREENATEVKELTSTVLSLKQRCKKLQYDSKQGKQTKRKKHFRVEYIHFGN